MSFAYKDTVEQDVFFTVGNRINLFQGSWDGYSRFCPGCRAGSKNWHCSTGKAREAARQRFLADLEQQVRDADESGFDIDATVNLKTAVSRWHRRADQWFR